MSDRAAKYRGSARYKGDLRYVEQIVAAALALLEGEMARLKI